MRNLLILSAAAAALAIPAAASAQRAPAAVIVLVDTQKVYNDCNACKTAQSQFQAQATTAQNRQKTLAGQLQPERDAIQKAIEALNGKEPDAALKTRVQNYQTKSEQAQQEVARAEQNLQSIRANIIRQIDAKFGPAVSQVMAAQGANIAVDMEGTIAHGAGTDVTAAVLAALNSTLTSISVTPLPQQTQQQQPQGR
ncbi:MAG TPA: OmpH family outer membrane protein [Sphingomicrobium sp.]|jgi:Skp family chaperone for outer membrane proteins|nr:OmpH family outer membrane protein [Sphingomicrobium sp.]